MSDVTLTAAPHPVTAVEDPESGLILRLNTPATVDDQEVMDRLRSLDECEFEVVPGNPATASTGAGGTT